MRAYPNLQAVPDGEALILFHEYSHGDNGRGVRTSHQTGWTGAVALLPQPRQESASAVVLNDPYAYQSVNCTEA